MDRQTPSICGTRLLAMFSLASVLIGDRKMDVMCGRTFVSWNSLSWRPACQGFNAC